MQHRSKIHYTRHFRKSMSNEEINPYASPQANTYAATDALADAEHPLHELPSCNVWGMIGLTVITLGLYVNFWTQRAANILNKNPEGEKISSTLVGAFWIVTVGSLLWIIPELLADDAYYVESFGSFLNRAGIVLTVVLSFTVRNRLNALTKVPPQHAAWFNGWWTFFFGVFYLQWKINRILRSSESLDDTEDAETS
jgi:hypothetical protein